MRLHKLVHALTDGGIVTSKLIMASALLALGTPLAAQAPAASTNITRAQVVSELNAAFARVDTNKDGVISVAEANAAQARVAAQAAAEVEKNVEAQFAQLDKDKNGQLSLAEFKAGAPVPKMVPGDQLVKLLDTNKDGKVSAAEFQAQRLRQFDALDTNHDGIVTLQERQAAGAH